MAVILVEKATGQAIYTDHFAAPREPKQFAEPGDAQWFVWQKFGQGRIDEFDIVDVGEWRERERIRAATAVTVEEVTDGGDVSDTES